MRHRKHWDSAFVSMFAWLLIRDHPSLLHALVALFVPSVLLLLVLLCPVTVPMPGCVELTDVNETEVMCVCVSCRVVSCRVVSCRVVSCHVTCRVSVVSCRMLRRSEMLWCDALRCSVLHRSPPMLTAFSKFGEPWEPENTSKSTVSSPAPHSDGALANGVVLLCSRPKSDGLQ